MFTGVVGTRVSGTVQGIGLLDEGTLGVLDEELGGLDPPFLGFHSLRPGQEGGRGWTPGIALPPHAISRSCPPGRLGRLQVPLDLPFPAAAVVPLGGASRLSK